MTHSLEVYFVMHSIFFILAKNNYVVQCFMAFVNIFLPYKLIFIRKKIKLRSTSPFAGVCSQQWSPQPPNIFG